MVAREHIVGRLGCGTRGANDGAVILAQHLQPRPDIIGMANCWHDPERRTKERASHLGNEFFARVRFRTERAGMIASKTGPMTGPMAEFMKGRAVPVDRLEISLWRRHVHEIA